MLGVINIHVTTRVLPVRKNIIIPRILLPSPSSYRILRIPPRAGLKSIAPNL